MQGKVFPATARVLLGRAFSHRNSPFILNPSPVPVSTSMSIWATPCPLRFFPVPPGLVRRISAACSKKRLGIPLWDMSTKRGLHGLRRSCASRSGPFPGSRRRWDIGRFRNFTVVSPALLVAPRLLTVAHNCKMPISNKNFGFLDCRRQPNHLSIQTHRYCA